MKVSREGISIKYHGFTLIYRWPILQTYFFQRRFKIEELDFDSDSLVDCLAEISKPNKPMKSNGAFQRAKKVSGFDFEDLTKLYSSVFFAESCGVMIFNINVLGKSFDFWQRIPAEHKKEFLKDAVFLKCNNPKEVERLMGSLPFSFCTAHGYVNGEMVYDNYIN